MEKTEMNKKLSFDFKFQVPYAAAMFGNYTLKYFDNKVLTEIEFDHHILRKNWIRFNLKSILPTFYNQLLQQFPFAKKLQNQTVST